LTPFHNMALMSPDTTTADVDAHLAVFAEAVGELLAPLTLALALTNSTEFLGSEPV